MSTNETTSESFTTTTSSDMQSAETLVVVSKIKKFIKEQSGFSTSKDAIDALSEKVSEQLAKGIESARTAGRKTVMARDIV